MIKYTRTGLLVVAGLLAAQTGASAAGAVAVGTCDRNGYSYSYANAALAQARALSECASNGDQRCRIVVNTRGNCGAFAVDAANRCGARGWAVAPNRRRAERLAVDACSGYGGRNCQVKAWTCDGGP